MNILPNPFLNSDATNPCASEAAAPSAPQSGAAATISEPSMTMEEPREAPAPDAPNQHPGSGALGTDCIGEIFYYARKLCAESRWFLPDYPDIYQAMLDPGAPRALDTDPVWADPAPLFLRAG